MAFWVNALKPKKNSLTTIGMFSSCLAFICLLRIYVALDNGSFQIPNCKKDHRPGPDTFVNCHSLPHDDWVLLTSMSIVALQISVLCTLCGQRLNNDFFASSSGSSVQQQKHRGGTSTWKRITKTPMKYVSLPSRFVAVLWIGARR
mmetsp:Transcript_7179/g.14165  ORF Transcript_7179/g.14165 Transcript_7179/m.14165 type:complete len:146 (+) Transcript_7179:180-617(+)